MANKTSFKSVRGAGNNFARKLWFARLRASGLYDSKCKEGLGKCKQKTKPSAGSLRQTKYANMSPKPKSGGKESATRGSKAIGELISEGKKKGKTTAQQRVALVKTLRGQGKQRGAKTSITQETARATTKGGTTNRTRFTAATGVSTKAKKAIGKEVAKQSADKTRKAFFDNRGKRKRSKDITNLAKQFRAQETGVSVATPRKKKK